MNQTDQTQYGLAQHVLVQNQPNKPKNKGLGLDTLYTPIVKEWPHKFFLSIHQVNCGKLLHWQFQTNLLRSAAMQVNPGLQTAPGK